MARKRKKISKPQKDPIHVKLLFHATFFLLLIASAYIIDLAYNNVVSLETANIFISMTFDLLLPSVVFSYLIAVRGNTVREIVQMLGLSKDRITKTALYAGVLLFMIIIIIELGISLFQAVTGIQVPSTNVVGLLAGAPGIFLLFTVFVAPFNEEVFFRGFLVPRIGIVFSGIIFAVLHAGYGSWTEFAGALIFGLLAGYFFKRTKSLYTTMLAHLLVNLVTVLLFVLIGQ